MNQMTILIIASAAALVLGAILTFLIMQVTGSRKLRLAQKELEERIAETRTKQKEVLLEAKEEAIKIRTAVEVENRERRAELQRLEKRLSQKESNLEHRLETLEQRERNIVTREKEAQGIRTHLDELAAKQLKQLELISGMSSNQAKELLLERIEGELKEETSRRIREWEARLKEEADQRSREILSMAIQRCAADVVSEATITVVPIPNDEMKGRLIGREGRNIRALEHATGVDLIIDDTPEAVTLSTFDPVRREVARVALNKLILDGRIHPARIEEMVAKAKGEVEATILSEGEQATFKAGVRGLNPELIAILGRLKYRTSYGQNVLAHSIETAQLSGMIAAELGADIGIAKRAGLLHDIGKALDHEMEGPHASIGAEVIKRWEKSADVIRAIAEHHGEVGSMSIHGAIVSTADALSGARAGARGESLEHYLKRLETLESIADSFQGVEKSFAIQAGREIRIIVKPDEIDDLQAARLARDIVKKIEEGMEYPGQIKVMVIRETRAIEYAK